MILKNKKFIISAAGDGIGFSITKFIVQNGGKVYLTDIDQQKIDKIKRNKKFNNKIFASQLDANNYNHVRKYFLSLSHLKKIDGLINNVGIAGPTKYVEKITSEEWQKTIETNLNSHFFFTKFAIPFLKRNKSGSIINLSSTAGLFGFPQRTPYAASKWAIIGLTKSLAMELGKYKIRVNAICPGSVEGDRMKRVISAKAKLLKTNPNKLQKEFESMTSMKSFVSKESIASIAIYLLSNNSTNISGQAIAVDGHTERMN
jgi:NAD(P)-dependent dehydrogenase (short-subunit alcohol dehydrogenase family)